MIPHPGRNRLLTSLTILTAGICACSTAWAQIPVDVLGHIPVADFTSLIAPQSYKDWGNEPFIAVNPLDPTKIVISSFGFGTDTVNQPGAMISYSTNGGASWGLRFPVTAPGAGVSTPRDWNFAYDSLGNLHAAMLGSVGNSFNVY